MRPLRPRSGIALLVVLVTIVVIGVVSAALFVVALSDARGARSSPDRARALWAAESGIALAATRDAWSPIWNATPRRGRLAQRVLAPGDGSLDSVGIWKLARADFLLVSTGVSGPPGAQARRRLGQLLTLRAPLVTPRATAVVDDGVVVEPGAWLSGADSAIAGWECDSAGAELPGAAAPDAAADRFGAVTRAELAERAVPLPSDAVLSGSPVVDVLGACDRGARANMGDPLRQLGSDSPCAFYHPVLYAPGSLRLAGGAGQGTLVVDGDLLLDSGARYFGLLLVRGELRVVEGAAVLGVVFAGRLAIGAGSAVRLSRCAAERAALAAGVPARAPGGWVEIR